MRAGFPRPQRAFCTAEHTFAVSTLGATFRREKVVEPASSEDVRPLRHAGGRLSNLNRGGGGVARFQIDGADVDCKVFERRAWRVGELLIRAREVHGTVFIPKELLVINVTSFSSQKKTRIQ